MAILSQNDYIAAPKQTLQILKTGAITTVAATWFSTLDVAGDPGAGSLSVGNTTSGVVPTDATSGFPGIDSFGGSARGYITQVDFGNTVASRLRLYDRLFHVGSLLVTSLGTTTLSGQPSFASRVSLNGGGPNYKGLQLWVEVNTAIPATSVTLQVQYSDDLGNGGRLTAAQSLFGLTTRQLRQFSLQAGDKGVSSVDALIVGGTAAASGSVNVFVARPLWTGRVRLANDGDTHGWDKTKFKQIFDDSAIGLMLAADGTASGIPDVQIEIASG
jgi:hypothetical protein